MVKQGLLILFIALLSQPFSAQPPDLGKYPAVSDKIIALDRYIEECFIHENYEEAKRISLQALLLSRKAKTDSLILKNLYNTGFAYKNLSNFDSAIFYFNNVLASEKKITPQLRTRTQLNLAT
ncbi:MAG TPA: hypothetical protein VIH57_25220, partial [Bacteroidales bacterium]